MADYEQQDQDGQEQSTRRGGFQQYPQRSNASSNWRMKDDAPRAEIQPRQNRGGYGAPRGGGYGQARESSDTRLYVGNLLYSAKRDDIAQFFNENGFNVANISMSVDPMTGRNPSYCFVDFESADDASRAMNELNGRDVLGRTVRINPGVAKRSDGQGQQGGSFNRGFGSGPRDGGPQGFGSAPRDGSQGYNRYNRNESQGQYGGYNRDNQESQGQSKRLYIGNLPAIESPEQVETAIHSLLDPLGVEVTKISNLIAPHESKQDLPGDHHFLFVDVSRSEDVDAAIEALDGKATPWSAESTLRVNRAREQANRRNQMGQGGYQGGFQGGFQGRRTEGQRDWRTMRQEAEQQS
ncbi:hypothetical protein LTS08_008128 [Lithohypha guttulata]|uniref:RRM domain-containing protein n=1 Tax=Lithohypha guttulata TaxID=1690604 RepID=A0AAN7T1R5_9EURO|nr:hypothetical protein LTR05_001985 [Lithohypha guttulata]KAK5095486.1 hypothetical protein LTS08_008128 [Lithohypha guttulata]